MPSARANIGLLNASILQETEHNFLKRSDLLMTVRHDRIILFKGKDSAFHAKKRDPLCDENLKKRSYQGTLSKSASKFISKQVTLWADSIEAYNSHFRLTGKQKQRQLVFLSVTLPAKQLHEDNYIKRHCLVPFIDTLKYHYKIQHYFWRAEAQKNGNIHFHIILDRYIPFVDAQNLWNQITERLGYVTRFAKKHGHFKPPTVHIRVINNTKNTIKYCLKYITKQEDTKPLKGRLWGMSDSIRCLRVPTFIDIDLYINYVLEAWRNKQCHMHFEEHFMSFSFKRPVINVLKRTRLAIHLKDLLFKIYSYLYFDDSPFDSDPAFTIYQGLDIDEIKSITRGL